MDKNMHLPEGLIFKEVDTNFEAQSLEVHINSNARSQKLINAKIIMNFEILHILLLSTVL